MTRYKVSTKLTVPYPPERREQRDAVMGTEHCAECFTGDPRGQWIYVDCAGIDRFCSWECLFVWTAWFMTDSDGDDRVKVKRVK